MAFAFCCSVHIVLCVRVKGWRQEKILGSQVGRIGMETRKDTWKLSQEERENTDGRKKRAG